MRSVRALKVSAMARFGMFGAALIACSSCTPRSPDCAAMPLDSAVPIEVGDAEFYDGDAIVITEIRGSAPAVRSGGSYQVKGRYRLASREVARLLFSVTATEGSGRSPIPGESVVAVVRGDGEFTLRRRLDTAGFPHLTFYDSDGNPFGGVYFGNDDTLLKRKSWRYRTP